MTVYHPEYQELVDWLTAKVAAQLNVAPNTIDFDTPLADYGIDSALVDGGTAPGHAGFRYGLIPSCAGIS